MVVFAFHAKTPAMDKASFIYKEAKYVVYWVLMFSTEKKKGGRKREENCSHEDITLQAEMERKDIPEGIL